MVCKVANADLTPITLRCGNNGTHLSNFSCALKKTWTMQTFPNRRISRQDRKSGTFLSLHLIGCGSCVFKTNVSRFGLSRCPCNACSTQSRRKASLFYQCRRHWFPINGGPMSPFRKGLTRTPAAMLVEIPQFSACVQISKQDAGIYQVKLRDDRGKDKSVLNLTEQGFQKVMNEVFKVIANSSTELQVTSTAEGIIIQSSVVYYTEELPSNWLHKDAKISRSDRVHWGVTEEQLWLKIKEPTEKDKGKYAINIFDGKDGVKRVLDLTGQVWETAYEEFQRLKAAAIAEKNRARVVGGLPDVVTIQEGKSLNLTGNIWGNPAPEVMWMKNEKELRSDEHYALKFEAGKFASITIAAVSTADSGKYSLVVKNKYGTEHGNFTVSVYMPEGEEAEEEGDEKKDKKDKKEKKDK